MRAGKIAACSEELSMMGHTPSIFSKRGHIGNGSRKDAHPILVATPCRPPPHENNGFRSRTTGLEIRYRIHESKTYGITQQLSVVVGNREHNPGEAKNAGNDAEPNIPMGNRPSNSVLCRKRYQGLKCPTDLDLLIHPGDERGTVAIDVQDRRIHEFNVLQVEVQQEAMMVVPSQNLVHPGNASELCRLGIGSA